MPAPAVIPALIAYVKVVAVKTLVVGIRPSEARTENPDLLPLPEARGGSGEDGRRSSAFRAVSLAESQGFMLRFVRGVSSGPGRRLP